MTIMLDTPEQINAWRLLSLRSLLHLHLKGVKQAGIVKAAQRTVPAEYGPFTTAHKALEAFNDWVGEAELLDEDKWTLFRVYAPNGAVVMDNLTFADLCLLSPDDFPLYTPIITRFIPKSAYQKD